MLLWLSVFFGVLAAILFAITVIGVSRIQSLTSTLGISRVMVIHRWSGILVLVLVLTHVVILMVVDSEYWQLLNPFSGTWASKFALMGTAALVTILRIARWRTQHYDAWRWIHLALAIIALVGITLHLLFLGHHYLPWVFMATVVMAVLIRRWVWVPLRGRRYTVVDIRRERDGIATVILSPHRRSRHTRIEFMKFQPGQFAWVRLRRLFAREEHPYTIASSTEDNTIQFTVKYKPGSFTNQFANLTVGQRVFLDGPHGSFTPYDRDLVLIAAGVGITPMISMLRSLADQEDSRRMILVHVGGQPLFSDEITALKNNLNLTIVPIIGQPVTAKTLGAVLPPRQRRHYHYYVCGPQSLIHDTLIGLRALQIPAGRIHTEQFFSASKEQITHDETNRPRSSNDPRDLARSGRHKHRPSGS